MRVVGRNSDSRRRLGSAEVYLNEVERRYGWTPPLSAEESLRRTPQAFDKGPRRPNDRGFTLVELLIVLVILGLIVGLVAPDIRQISRISKSQEEWLKLERQIDQLVFESYVSGYATRLNFEGKMISWQSGGSQGQIYLESVFFEKKSIYINEKGIFSPMEITGWSGEKRKTINLKSGH